MLRATAPQPWDPAAFEYTCTDSNPGENRDTPFNSCKRNDYHEKSALTERFRHTQKWVYRLWMATWTADQETDIQGELPLLHVTGGLKAIEVPLECSFTSSAMSGQALTIMSIYPLITSADRPLCPPGTPRKSQVLIVPKSCALQLELQAVWKLLQPGLLSQRLPGGRRNHTNKIIQIIQQITYSPEKGSLFHSICHSHDYLEWWTNTTG